MTKEEASQAIKSVLAPYDGYAVIQTASKSWEEWDIGIGYHRSYNIIGTGINIEVYHNSVYGDNEDREYTSITDNYEDIEWVDYAIDFVYWTSTMPNGIIRLPQ